MPADFVERLRWQSWIEEFFLALRDGWFAATLAALREGR